MLVVKNWTIWWEKKRFLIIPHIVLYFGNRPENYWVGVFDYDGKLDKLLKADPYHDLTGVLIQKRDVLLYIFSFAYFRGQRFRLVEKGY